MAERNFDEEFKNDEKEGHSFTLGGFTFNTPPVGSAGAFLNMGRGYQYSINFLRKMVLPEQRPNLERILELPDSSPNLIEIGPELLSAVESLLAAEELGLGKDEALVKLKDVAARAAIAAEPHDGPNVAIGQIDQVAEWLMEATIGRPTSSSSPSSTGAGRTSNGLKGTSSRRVKAGAS